jgi:RNA polymerase primary sigma factor
LRASADEQRWAGAYVWRKGSNVVATNERRNRDSAACCRRARAHWPLCDQVRRRNLLRDARRGDREARERLVVAHLGLIRTVASHYRDLGLSFDDLVQEGSLGLLDAIDRYDPAREVVFEAFARFRVRRAIRNALTDQARLIRLPKQIVEKRRLLARTEAKLTAANGRGPTLSELAAATGLSLPAVREARTAPIAPVSLDEQVVEDGSALESLVADANAPDPETEAISAERALRVRDAVAALPPRQREIIRKRFGFGGDIVDVATLADRLRISERRTRTIEHDGLHELAAELEAALRAG